MFGPAVVKIDLLPLGFQFTGHRQLAQQLGHNQSLQPSQQNSCDLQLCTSPVNSEVLLFRCGHSFHRQCVAGVDKSTEHCFICVAGISLEVRAKATTARAAIFNPDANPGQGNDSSSDDDDDNNLGNADLGAQNAPDMTEHEAHTQMVLLAHSIATLPAVPLL